jgi:XTP/dITP diphosphohydrolase
MRLLIATTNPHKVAEIRRVLDGLGIEFLTLDGWPHVQPPEETGITFDENARAKADYYARATAQLTVAEDSGLEIEALAGVPGVHSARYGGEETSYPEKFALLYRALASAKAPESAARFVCAVALATPTEILFETRGVVTGTIAPAPRGSNGFGYDPIFFYPPYGRTLGEVSAQEKLAVSHRGHAFRQLRQFLLNRVSSMESPL